MGIYSLVFLIIDRSLIAKVFIEAGMFSELFVFTLNTRTLDQKEVL